MLVAIIFIVVSTIPKLFSLLLLGLVLLGLASVNFRPYSYYTKEERVRLWEWEWEITAIYI